MKQKIAQSIGWMLTHVPWLRIVWARRTKQVAQQTAIPWTPLRKPLSACRIALITTGGVHLRSQPPFDMDDLDGDATYRIIAADTPAEQLMITHNYYDHRDADRDLNILFPLALLHDFAREGQIASVGTCYGFMGHILNQHLATLTERTAPEVAARLKREHVDAVVLTPA